MKRKIDSNENGTNHSIVNTPITTPAAPVASPTFAPQIDRDALFNLAPPKFAAVGLLAWTWMLLAKLSLAGLYCCDGKPQTDMITSTSVL